MLKKTTTFRILHDKYAVKTSVRKCEQIISDHKTFNCKPNFFKHFFSFLNLVASKVCENSLIFDPKIS